MRICLANLTVGGLINVGWGEKASTLMARDYKDPQCVVVAEECDEMEVLERGGNGRDAVRQKCRGGVRECLTKNISKQ